MLGQPIRPAAVAALDVRVVESLGGAVANGDVPLIVPVCHRDGGEDPSENPADRIFNSKP